MKVSVLYKIQNNILVYRYVEVYTRYLQVPHKYSCLTNILHLQLILDKCETINLINGRLLLGKCK